MKSFNKAVLLAGALTACMGIANAGTIVYGSVTANVSATCASYTATDCDATKNLADTEWTYSFLLPKWDPALFAGQHLIGITIYATASVGGTIDIDNTSPTANTKYGTNVPSGADNAQASVDILGPVSIELNPVPVFHVGGGTLGPGGHVSFSLSGTDSKTENPATVDFSNYIGSGHVSLSGDAVDATTITLSGGHGVLTPNVKASGDVAIQYDFVPNTPTPEPATMGLLGSALIGLSLIVRRKAVK